MHDVKNQVIQKQIEIGQNHTTSGWSSFCRKVCYDYIVTKKTPIGVPEKIVEINETLVGKRKYNQESVLMDNKFLGNIAGQTVDLLFLLQVVLRDLATL